MLMKKLKLKKEIIANLTHKEQSAIKGGSLLPTCNTILVICKTTQTGDGCYPPPPPGPSDTCSTEPAACTQNTCQP